MINSPRTAQVVLLTLLLGLLVLIGTTAGARGATVADRDCGDFDTQAAAQRFFLNNDPASDPHRLDSDGDRIACETLPCPCNTSTSGTTTKTSTVRHKARIVRVIDGDTVDARLRNGKIKRVRMIGINTPERGRCGYTRASRTLSRFLPQGQWVVLISDPTQDRIDRYGRWLRYVKKGRRDANRRQVARGVARVYVYDNTPFKRVTSYRKALRAAKADDRGLWRQCW